MYNCQHLLPTIFLNVNNSSRSYRPGQQNPVPRGTQSCRFLFYPCSKHTWSRSTSHCAKLHMLLNPIDLSQTCQSRIHWKPAGLWLSGTKSSSPDIGLNINTPSALHWACPTAQRPHLQQLSDSNPSSFARRDRCDWGSVNAPKICMQI